MADSSPKDVSTENSMVQLMSKPVGGRGKRAPYSSRPMRVPDPIRPQVEKLVTAFYESDQQDEVSEMPDLETAITEARAILKAKKSARASLQRLLTVLYKTSVKL
mgnify:CR=1 FL=1|jgi:hypothetical protein